MVERVGEFGKLGKLQSFERNRLVFDTLASYGEVVLILNYSRLMLLNTWVDIYWRP